MKKIAVFGKPGGGKSTFSRLLAKSIDVPLHALDLIEYNKDGTKIDAKMFELKHQEILNTDKWIIDGFGTINSFFRRIDCADTLIYIDLPYLVHYWWVTKRLLKSMFIKPEDWPEGSSVLKGTISSYKTLKICPQFWNEKFENSLNEKFPKKNIVVFKSIREMNKYIKNESYKSINT